jgi:hypothetical protein
MIARRMLAAGIVAGAVAVGGVAGALIGIPGLSSASSSTGTSGTSGATGPTGAEPPGWHFRGSFRFRLGADKDVLDAAAKALNLTTEQLLQKLSDGKTTIADIAKQENVDVQTVINDMEAVANQDIQNLVNNPLPAPPKFPELPNLGGGGLGFAFGFPGVRDALDPIAKALGITTEELQTDLRNGQSVADIAKAKNIPLSTVVSAVMTEVQNRLDQLVKDKKLSQDQADRLEARLKDRITDALSNSLPKGLGGLGFGFRFRGGPGHPGHAGPDGGWPGPPGMPTPSAAPALGSVSG